MPRPFTDIALSKSGSPIKNGTCVTSTTVRGRTDKLNTHVSNTPTISDIQSKYGNRFYNGVFVTSLNANTVLTASEYSNLGTYNSNTVYYVV